MIQGDSKWAQNVPPGSMLPGVTQSMNLSIDQNQNQSITINRLILEIDEQSMRQDSVTFHRFPSKKESVANKYMLIDANRCNYAPVI